MNTANMLTGSRFTASATKNNFGSVELFWFKKKTG